MSLHSINNSHSVPKENFGCKLRPSAMARIFPTNLGKTYRKTNTISTDICKRESSNPTQYKHPLEKEQFNPLFEIF